MSFVYFQRGVGGFWESYDRGELSPGGRLTCLLARTEFLFVFGIFDRFMRSALDVSPPDNAFFSSLTF
jgi:hypothetical protein